MKTTILTIILFFAGSVWASAQQHDHAKCAHHHGHGRNEIGVSVGKIYSFEHDKWGSGIHLHYFRTLGDHSRWAAGAFAEQAWVDGAHFSVGAGMKFEALHGLHFGVFPGITFLNHAEGDGHDHHGDSKSRFSLHTEVVYDMIVWGNFHLGPVVDYSWSKGDSHAMLGIHAAYSF